MRQTALIQIGVLQIGALEVRSLQVCPIELSSMKIRHAQICPVRVFAGTAFFLYTLVHEAVRDVDGAGVSAQQRPAIPTSTPSARARSRKGRFILTLRCGVLIVSFSVIVICQGDSEHHSLRRMLAGGSNDGGCSRRTTVTAAAFGSVMH